MFHHPRLLRARLPGRDTCLLVLSALLTGCASAGSGTHGSPSSPGATPAAATSSGAQLTPAEMEEIYRSRLEAARTRFTEADVRFMTGMIHHHAQAIEISLLVPARGSDPSIRTLAARIINAQSDEIATMQRWLRDRGQAAPELHQTAEGVMVHGGESAHAHHMHGMAGMLTSEQIEELRGARGPRFDRLFLERMIEHHRGAVSMVLDLFATDGAGQDEAVFRFASDVQVDQATEVARMERMLSTLPPGDGPL
jgi:uncharacterized protein (DUF305 family)